MRYIFQLMVTPLMFLVNRQCRVFTALPLSLPSIRHTREMVLAPRALLTQFAPFCRIEPQDANTKAEHESRSGNADAKSNCGAGGKALLEMMCTGVWG